MKTPFANSLAKSRFPIFTSTQPFNLLLTTSHPESTDAWAGEVVQVPVEFAGGAVLLDLREVKRIDSCGLALFLEATQRIAARGGRLFLVRIDEQIRRVLETAKLDQIFHIAPTREHALAELHQPLAA